MPRFDSYVDIERSGRTAVDVQSNQKRQSEQLQEANRTWLIWKKLQLHIPI